MTAARGPLGRGGLWLPIALLLLAAGLPTATYGQTAAADAAVTSLMVAGPQPAWQDRMPIATRLEAQVTNVGSAPLSYTIAYYWAGTSDYLNGDAASSTDASRTPLAPGQSATHGVDWTPLPHQFGARSVVAVVAASGDRAPANNAFTLPLEVPVREVRFTWSGEEDPSLRVEETRFFRLQVENLGLQPQEFAATPLASAPGLQATVEPATLAVPVGGTASLDLFVHRPEGSGASVLNYTVALRDASAPGWMPTSPSVTLQPTDAPLAAGDLATTVEVRSGVPRAAGSAFDIVFEVRNDGSAADSLAMVPEGPHGWGLAATPDRVALLHGESALVHLSGGAPPDAVPGAATTLTLKAVSERGAAGDAAASVTLRASGPAIQLSNLTLPEHVYQGDTPVASVVVRNVGNQPAPAGTLFLLSDPEIAGLGEGEPVPGLPAGGRAAIEVPFTPARSEPVLRPGGFAVLDANKDGLVQETEGVYVALRPHAPSEGFTHPEGKGTLGPGDVRLNVTGAAPGSQILNSSKEKDLGKGPLLPLDGTLWCQDPDGDLACQPGGTLYLDLARDTPAPTVSPGDLRLTPHESATGAPLLRAGSRVLPQEPDTGVPLAEATGWAITFADRNGDSDFDASEPVYLDHGGRAASPGDVRLTPLTGARGVVVEPFGSTVADGDLDDGTRLARGPFGTVAVDGLLGPVTLSGLWMAADESMAGVSTPAAAEVFVRTAQLKATAPPAFAASPGESLLLGIPPGAFQVANLGNAAEEVRLLAEASSGTVTLPQGDLLELAPGQSRIVPLEVDLPPAAQAATVELRLTAWLEHHPETEVTAVVQVALPDLAPPAVAFLPLPPVWDPTRPLVVALDATDDVGVANVTVLAEADGKVRSAAARLDDDGLWRAEMALPAGNHALRATAIDAANRTAAAGPVTVEVRPVPPPVLVRLAPDDGDLVWPNGTVLAVVRDPTGISAATLRIDGGPALHLDVDPQGSDTLFLQGTLGDLTPGSHRLALEVVNGAGVPLQHSFQVTTAKDQAPPPATDTGRDAPGGAAPLLAAGLLLLGALRRRGFRGIQPDRLLYI